VIILSGVKEWRVDEGFCVVDMSSTWRSGSEADVVSGVGPGTFTKAAVAPARSPR
jgi:hypothetical protein